MATFPQGTPVIIDIGSAYVKAGFAGNPVPQNIFPTITGKKKYKSIMVDAGSQMQDLYIGEAAMKLRGVLNLNHPIQRGAIVDWNEYYEILNHIFYTLLRLENPQNHPIIYIESVSEQKDVREFIARVLFETHQFQSIIMIPSPILSCFSVGLTTGLVIESGDGNSWVVPIINGQIIYRAIQKLALAGTDIIHNLESLLMREGISISSSASSEILKQIKENYCYVVLDPDNPGALGEKIQYPLPDGSTIEIPPHILYEATEVMFEPSMIGSNSPSLPEAVLRSLNSIDKSYWGDLLTHIVLSGGNFLHNGFKERLESELISLLNQYGPIPKPHKIQTERKVKTLQPVKTVKKNQDTCPSCGTLVDLSKHSKCPNCGQAMNAVQIDIGSKGKGSIKCPLCNKEIADSSSLFCPYCGFKLEPEEQKSDLLEQEADTSEENTPPPPLPNGQDSEPTEYFTSSSDFLRFFVPDELQTAIFSGAAILGSLPSFNQLFITQAEFQANREILSRDISEIFSLDF
ncbi:MAG: putative Actin/actin family protein [Promethearchaeota archaeon]|nr:MAG: putative Actin/actin family protein [Candidatus Lokiarchaeota archaeon]